MKKMMAIFAHPDDEGAIAGTLAKYAQLGVDVTLVCATRGELGEISDPKLATKETLPQVRAQELQTAVNILGINHVHFLDRRDSGMDGWPENNDPRALIQTPPAEIEAALIQLMRQTEPDIVITFEPFGWYGHPDHIFMGKWATAAYKTYQNEATHPPQGLFHAVIPFSGFSSMIQEALAGGYIESSIDIIGDGPKQAQLDAETAVTHVIDIRPQFETKRQSMAAHQTQFSPDHMFNKIPSELMIKTSGAEYFIQIEPVPEIGATQYQLNDLFATT